MVSQLLTAQNYQNYDGLWLVKSPPVEPFLIDKNDELVLVWMHASLLIQDG
jgi:hypothetical protein